MTRTLYLAMAPEGLALEHEADKRDDAIDALTEFCGTFGGDPHRGLILQVDLDERGEVEVARVITGDALRARGILTADEMEAERRADEEAARMDAETAFAERTWPGGHYA